MSEREKPITASPFSLSVRTLRYAVTVAFLGTVALMGAGTYSVAIRGWMSCGGFPQCGGTLVPLLDPGTVQTAGYTMEQIVAEWAHRAIAFVTGVVMLGGTVVAWRWVRGYTLTTWLVAAATALLPFEAWLGVMTGVANPPRLLVSIHLVISLLVLSLLALATLIVWRPIVFGSDGTRRETHT